MTSHSARTYLVDSPQRAQSVAERIRGLDTRRPWELCLKPYRRLRTLNQNRRYWKLLQIASQETGNDAEDLHEFFKGKYLEPVTVSMGNEARIVPSSTTRLKTDEFSEYVNRVESFLAGEGIWLDS